MKRNLACIAVVGVLAFANALSAGDGDILWGDHWNPVSAGNGESFSIIPDGSGGAILAIEDNWTNPYPPPVLSSNILATRLDGSGNSLWGGVSLCNSSDCAHGENPALCSDGAGGAIIAWGGYKTSLCGTFVQRVGSSGTALWSHPVILGGASCPTPPIDGCEQPVICADGNDGALVGFGSRLAQVDANGQVAAPGPDGVVVIPEDRGTFELVAAPAISSFYCAWRRPDTSEIRLQRYYAGAAWGASGVLLASQYTSKGFKIAAQETGALLVVWAGSENVGHVHYQIRAQKVNSNGTKAWAADVILLDTDTVGGSESDWSIHLTPPSVVSDGFGGAIVAWTDCRNSGTESDLDVYAQRISAGGSILWGAQGRLVPPAHKPHGIAMYRQTSPSLIADGWGGAVIGYEDVHYGTDIGATALDANGLEVWSRWVYWDGTGSSDPGDNQSGPKIVFDGAGPAPIGPVLAYVDDHNSISASKVQLDVSAPVNDNCANAIAIQDGQQYGTFGRASQDGDASCLSGGADVWYQYTAAQDGMLTVTTCGTNDGGSEDQAADTALSIYSGCPGTAGNEVTCNDTWTVNADPTACSGTDGGEARDAAVRLPVSAGQTFWICVARVGTFGGGAFTLNVSLTPGFTNDACAGASQLAPGWYLGTLAGATNDGSASCGGYSGQPNTEPDVWGAYTAPQDGILRVSTCGTNDWGAVDAGMDTVLSLHSGCPGTSSNELACNDDWPYGSAPAACNGPWPFLDAGNPRDSALAVPVVAGQTVWTRLAKYPASEAGVFYFIFGFIVPPDFDQDEDVDSDDLAAFEACASGPEVPLASGCEKADLDHDGDVDQEDFGTFQKCFGGTGNPADPDCST